MIVKNLESGKVDGITQRTLELTGCGCNYSDDLNGWVMTRDHFKSKEHFELERIWIIQKGYPVR